jgi:hypothetical protein
MSTHVTGPVLGQPLHGRGRRRARVIQDLRPAVRLHLLTYGLANMVFWILWAAISVETDHWYWWPVVPIAGWTALLVVHLWHGRNGGSRS